MAKYKATLVPMYHHKTQDDGVNYYVTFLAANPGQARQRLADYFPGFVICDIKLMPEGKPDIQATFDFDVYGAVARVIGCTRQETKFKILQEVYGLIPQPTADPIALHRAGALGILAAKEAYRRITAIRNPLVDYKNHVKVCLACSLVENPSFGHPFAIRCHEGVRLLRAAHVQKPAKPYDPNKCIYCGDDLICGQCMGRHMHTPEQLEEVIGCAGGIFCVCKPGWGHKSEWRETVFVCARHQHLKFPCAVCGDKSRLRKAISKGHLRRITADLNSFGSEL